MNKSAIPTTVSNDACAMLCAVRGPDLSQVDEGELSTMTILEALGLNVRSRDETANPPLPKASVRAGSSVSCSEERSASGPLQQPTPESLKSEARPQHCPSSNPSGSMRIITGQSSTTDLLSLSPSQLSHLEFQSEASSTDRQSQAASVIIDRSRSSSPAIDMCAQFVAAVGYPQHKPAQPLFFLPKSTSPQNQTNEATFFDFDRYRQENLIYGITAADTSPRVQQPS